jgi:sodium/hydrogen antiporter
MGAELATVGLALLLVASISRRLSGSPVTPAMLVVAIGVLAGPLLIDELTVAPTSATVRRLAEATLTAAGCDLAMGHRRARGRSRS